MIYKNNEIEITFPDSWASDDEKPYFKSGYFSKSTEHIKFCEVEPQPAYVQQVNSEDGYLCSMYILPLKDEQDILTEIETAFKPKGALSSFSGVEKLKIGKYKVLKWRAQNGKARLDHYLLKAKNNYYLFVSSPYGSNGYIEDIIAKVKMLK